MEINKKLTQDFYLSFEPCTCGDCKYFIKNIEKEQPEICSFLQSLEIDPLKPYELVSFVQDNKIEYIDNAYIVIGKLKKEHEEIINGIKVNFYFKENHPHPTVEFEDDYFIVAFGPIELSYNYSCQRHLTYENKIKLIKKAIDEVDPMELLKIGCPKDEYLIEAKLIANKMFRTNYISWKTIQDIFHKQFDEILPDKVCKHISQRIIIYFNNKDYLNYFEENDILKGKASINNLEIKLKVHDDFIVTHKGISAYLNGKFYRYIEDQDLLDSLCGFVEDDYVYVQYKHKHFRLTFYKLFSYFKKIPKKKYSFNKLHHKNDIDLIFDNKHLIYSSHSLDKQIIDRMYYEPIEKEYEKVFYSPDKKYRLIIFKTQLNSYSFNYEKLYIVDKQEKKFYGKDAFWEPIMNGSSASYYQNIESLLKDISNEIKGWIEK